MSDQGNSRERLSESPYVANVWHGVAETNGAFTAPADGRWELIVKTVEGQTSLIVSGPVTKAAPASFSAGTEILSIKFRLGTFMPHLPVGQLLDTRLLLPQAAGKAFWLHGRAWQIPNFENADTFVNRLMRDEIVQHDPLMTAALRDEPLHWSVHTVRRRFLKATGFTQSTLRQIERSHHAAALLAQGMSILDTVEAAGYFDQPHLTRSLKHFIGQTPAQIAGLNAPVIASTAGR